MEETTLQPLRMINVPVDEATYAGLCREARARGIALVAYAREDLIAAAPQAQDPTTRVPVIVEEGPAGMKALRPVFQTDARRWPFTGSPPAAPAKDLSPVETRVRRLFHGDPPTPPDEETR